MEKVQRRKSYARGFIGAISFLAMVCVCLIWLGLRLAVLRSSPRTVRRDWHRNGGAEDVWSCPVVVLSGTFQGKLGMRAGGGEFSTVHDGARTSDQMSLRFSKEEHQLSCSLGERQLPVKELVDSSVWIARQHSPLPVL